MIKLQNQDCLQFLENVPSDSVGHVNCDPPYNIGYDGGDDWDTFDSDDSYLEWSSKWISECTRALSPGRMFVVWGTQKNDLFFRLKLEVLNKIPGLVSQNPIHWSYNWGGRSKKNFAHKNETAWCYSKGKEFLFDSASVEIERKMKTNIRTGLPFENGTIPTTIWEGNLATGSNEAKESNWHPTVKPQFVLQRMIRAYTKEKETILDCFSGSGSTAVASLLTNRDFIGCERNETYFSESQKRIEKYMKMTIDPLF